MMTQASIGRRGENVSGFRLSGVRQLACALLMIVVAGTVTGLPVGRLTHFDGEVSVVSEGRRTPAESLYVGAVIQDYDVIITGPEGFAEVELDVAPAGTLIRVQPESACYVSNAVEPGGSRTEVRMLSGRSGFDVTPTRRSQRFSVRTNAAVLGVRGTQFDVINSPDEATLVGIREGAVAVELDSGDVVSEAGTVMEAVAGSRPQTAVVSDGAFEQYYERWHEIRMDVFRSGASTFVQAYVRRFWDLDPQFQEAYASLLEHLPALQQALSEQGSMSADVQLRMKMSPAVVRVRSLLPMYESTVYRLRELQRYHREGIGVVSIGEQSSTEFFRQFAMREGDLVRQLSEVRSILRDYSHLQDRGFGDGFPNIPSPFDTSPGRPQF